MEKWAKSIPNVQFLCICVESIRVAIAFHYMFEFDACVNAFIPPQVFGSLGYGQLGCSGFVVMDNRDGGFFVSKRTRAFLDYGEMAFVHVESILATMLEEEENEQPKQSGDKEEEKKDNTIEPVHVASTGVDAMDDEHKECTDSLNKTLEAPTKENLIQLHSILKSHFDHEEQLMNVYFEKAIQDATVSSSTVELHTRDHQRILNIALKELNRITGGGCDEGK